MTEALSYRGEKSPVYDTHFGRATYLRHTGEIYSAHFLRFQAYPLPSVTEKTMFSCVVTRQAGRHAHTHYPPSPFSLPL